MEGTAGAWARLYRRLRRAREAQSRRSRDRTLTGRIATAGVCLLAGLLVMVSAMNARGTDLRPGRNTDLVSLVQSQSRRNAELAGQLSALRDRVDQLTQDQASNAGLQPELEQQAGAAGLRAVSGPALTVTLDDAPQTVAADGVDADLLVVHQQDIQAMVNALWSGGAEAMTIQGQRVISTTGIKCVGNTVVLHGIPYAPPYVISAIGDQARLGRALEDSRYVRIYQQYVDAYGLTYDVRLNPRAQFPAHLGSLELDYAQPLNLEPSPR
jgi:uncharacterized protein YlxW (UPF0749 family)